MFHCHTNERGDHYACSPNSDRTHVLLQVQENGQQARIKLTAVQALDLVRALAHAARDVVAPNFKAGIEAQIDTQAWKRELIVNHEAQYRPHLKFQPEAGETAGPENADLLQRQGVSINTSEGKEAPARGYTWYVGQYVAYQNCPECGAGALYVTAVRVADERKYANRWQCAEGHEWETPAVVNGTMEKP